MGRVLSREMDISGVLTLWDLRKAKPTGPKARGQAGPREVFRPRARFDLSLHENREILSPTARRWLDGPRRES